MYVSKREALGEAPSPRKQPRRCLSLDLRVPGTHAALEEVVRRWIGTCVMSRTAVRPGVPIRREHALVTGNSSLQALWDRVLKHMKGQPVKISAQYIWGPNRVESINFTTSATPPEIIQVPGPKLDSIERIVRRGFQLIQNARLSNEQKRRIGCSLLRLVWRGGDDRFITSQAVLDFRNFTYKQQPNLSRAKQWLLPEYVQRTGQMRADEEILKSLIRIDEAIIDGRHKINQEFAQGGATVHVRVRSLRDWVANRQKDRLSIYYCYRA